MSMSPEPSDSQQPPVAHGSVWQQARWLLVITFVITCTLAGAISFHIHQSHSAGRRLATQLLAQGYAQRLQERLQTALVSTYVLSSVVKQSGGRVPNFNDVAAELLTLFPGVSALQLAPDGIIQEIYPLEGNEAAVGHNLLADRKRNREAAVAVTTQQLTLAGPFNLIQGGVGAVGRLPVFLTNERHENYFWGFAIALIRIPSLLEAAGFDGLAKAGYRYELWRINPDTEERHVFARNGPQPPIDPVEYVVTVYNGRWVLSLAPEEGWLSTVDVLESVAFAVGVAVVVTLLQYFGIRFLLRKVAAAAEEA